MKSRIANLLIIVSIIGSFGFGALPVEGKSGNNFFVVKRQTIRTIRGYYCGQQSGNRAGEFYFRVGREVRSFSMNFGQKAGGNAKAIGFRIGNIKIGNEYLVSYRAGDGDFIQSIKSTGRSKKIEPCPAE